MSKIITAVTDVRKLTEVDSCQSSARSVQRYWVNWAHSLHRSTTICHCASRGSCLWIRWMRPWTTSMQSLQESSVEPRTREDLPLHQAWFHSCVHFQSWKISVKASNAQEQQHTFASDASHHLLSSSTADPVSKFLSGRFLLCWRLSFILLKSPSLSDSIKYNISHSLEIYIISSGRLLKTGACSRSQVHLRFKVVTWQRN